MTRPPDLDRHLFLIRLSPLEAAHILFDGDFWPGDETALCFSIRKRPGIDLGDDALLDLFFETVDRGLGPEAFLERAASS